MNGVISFHIQWEIFFQNKIAAIVSKNSPQPLHTHIIRPYLQYCFVWSPPSHLPNPHPRRSVEFNPHSPKQANINAQINKQPPLVSVDFHDQLIVVSVFGDIPPTLLLCLSIDFYYYPHIHFWRGHSVGGSCWSDNAGVTREAVSSPGGNRSRSRGGCNSRDSMNSRRQWRISRLIRRRPQTQPAQGQRPQ